MRYYMPVTPAMSGKNNEVASVSSASAPPYIPAHSAPSHRSHHMPITCPDPATLFRWRDTMAQAGVGMLVAAAMLVIAIWVMRPSSRRLRLASGLSAALALIVAVASFVLYTRLSEAPAQVARWFPDYPDGCTPGAPHWTPGYIANIERFAQQAVAPLERAAAIDLAVAFVALLAIWAATLACIRAASRRDLTTVTLYT
jgi:hypothetical protein